MASKQKKKAKRKKKIGRKSSSSTTPTLLLWIKRFLMLGLLVGLVTLIIISLYAAHLNRTVVPKFEGRRWSLPSQVYAQPQELYIGAALKASQLEKQLDDLGYARGRPANEVGTYQRRGNVVNVHVRPFQFWDEKQEAKQLQIVTSAGYVTQLLNVETGRDEAIFRLDPLMLGTLFAGEGEDRIIVKLTDVPVELRQGLVAVEDRKFYDHNGIDLKGIVRAALANLKAMSKRQGASTLTQQMTRSYFYNNERTFRRKIKEILVALLLERKYAKEDILETYFNEIYMGQAGKRSIHGMGLASRYYFNKPLSELELHESAVLITLLRGPSYYNPRRNQERVLKRRNLVLGIMHDQGVISEEQRDSAQAKPLDVSKKPPTGTSRYSTFLDLVKQQLERDYEKEVLSTAGLKIFTTLLPDVQKQAEKSLSEGLSQIEKKQKLDENSLQGAVVVTSVNGAEIQALVGGREAGFEGFNRALQARRPIGSLMKPFVYLAAFENGKYQVNTALKDEPIELVQKNGDIWKPENYNKKFSGEMPLFRALSQSKNIPTVSLGLDIGVDKVMQMAADMGLENTPPAFPAMLLGSLNLAPVEVAQMYNSLANIGYRTPLRSVRAVLDETGEPLKRYKLKVKEVVKNESVIKLNSILNLVTREGTAGSLQRTIPKRVLAGKTGTSDDYRDSWFAGFSGDVNTVVWVGNDDNESTGLTGASGALPIWTSVMKEIALQDYQHALPEELILTSFDFETGYRKVGCPDGIMLPATKAVMEQESYITCTYGDARPVDATEEEKRSILDWFR